MRSACGYETTHPIPAAPSLIKSICISASVLLGNGQPPLSATSFSVIFNMTKLPDSGCSFTKASKVLSFSISVGVD